MTERTGTGVGCARARAIYYLILSGFGKKRCYKSVKTRTRVFFGVTPFVTSSCWFGLWLCCSLVAVMVWIPFQMPLRDAKNTRTGDSNAVSRTAESWTRIAPFVRGGARAAFLAFHRSSARTVKAKRDRSLRMMVFRFWSLSNLNWRMQIRRARAARALMLRSRGGRIRVDDARARHTDGTLNSTRAQGYRILQGNCINAFCLKHQFQHHLQSNPDEHQWQLVFTLIRVKQKRDLET